MKNKIILTGVFLLFSFFASAQIDYDVPINQYNANGQKEGFWREKIDEGTIFELYYINGKRSGVFKYFSGKGALISFGEYKDGKEIGTWYFYDKNIKIPLYIIRCHNRQTERACFPTMLCSVSIFFVSCFSAVSCSCGGAVQRQKSFLLYAIIL